MAARLTRRSVVAGSVAMLAAASTRAWPQTAAARFSGVRVDASPLAARSAAASASFIQQIMPAKLASVFGDLVSPGARGLPVLVARIDTIYLNGDADVGPGSLESLQRDTMSGAGLVVAGGTVQSSTPLNVNLPPGYSGAWYQRDIDARRVDSLCYQFAYWLRREMQL